MEISGEHRRQREHIIQEMESPKDFQCYKSDFENISKIKIVAEGKLPECQQNNRKTCNTVHKEYMRLLIAE